MPESARFLRLLHSANPYLLSVSLSEESICLNMSDSVSVFSLARSLCVLEIENRPKNAASLSLFLSLSLSLSFRHWASALPLPLLHQHTAPHTTPPQHSRIRNWQQWFAACCTLAAAAQLNMGDRIEQAGREGGGEVH